MTTPKVLVPTAQAQRGEGPAWHALPPEEALARLGSDAASGLGAEEAARRLAAYGPNALPEQARRSRLLLFLRQLQSPLSGARRRLMGR
jgi:magnesium-transporting ATPase (P-type)